MLKADFHVHTGDDKFHSLEYSSKEAINHMAKLGYGVLAITNHHKIYYNQELAGHAQSKGILLIPGIEKQIENCDVLLINLTEKDAKDINSFSDLKKLKERNKNALVIAPHPFVPFLSNLSKRLEENIHYFDAIEYSNFYILGMNFNKKAVKLAKKYNKPMVGTSDAHNLFQLNNTYSLVNSEKNADAVVDAVKKGNVELQTKRMSYYNFARLMKSVFIERLKMGSCNSRHKAYS